MSTQTMSPEEFQPRYTLEEAAAIADCSYATAWRAAKAGELVGTRRGKKGRWRFSEHELSAWAFRRVSR